jgi:hypothetical protein
VTPLHKRRRQLFLLCSAKLLQSLLFSSRDVKVVEFEFCLLTATITTRFVIFFFSGIGFQFRYDFMNLLSKNSTMLVSSHAGC